MLIDTHVHLYPCYALGPLISRLLSRSQPVLCCLCERQHQANIEHLPGQLAKLGFNYKLDTTLGMLAVLRPTSAEPGLLLVRGFQVVASERIEILLLGAQERPPDGSAAAEVVHSGLQQGALVCLSWSVGKWLGKRGKIVSALLQQFGPKICIGDICIRARGTPSPRQFTEAQRLQIPILRGSDPLPMPGDEALISSYAQEIAGALPELSATGLRQLLLQLRESRPTGQAQSLPAALWRYVRSHRAACPLPPAKG